VVGPEEPLVRGLADHLRAQGVAVVGPGAAAAQLEGSKQFAKAFMQRHGVPTARFAQFDSTQLEQALAYVRQHPLPLVVKADGLAAGKGVLICNSVTEAEQAIEAMLRIQTFGPAGARIVVEEFLAGVEVSAFALCSGTQYVLLPFAKDYKRALEGDCGLNTGGMGAVSPVPFADDAFAQRVCRQVIEPTLQGLEAEGIPFNGFLFVGLMVVPGQGVYVLEYNVRMGDPETEAVLPRLAVPDFADLLFAAATGKLSGIAVGERPEHACTVVCVSDGYPEKYPTGFPISRLDQAAQYALVFQAGTKIAPNGDTVTSGGRVLALTALGTTLELARASAMRAAAAVEYEGKYFRRDIAEDLLQPTN
jgi:phosphoribosylamine--glycine ligase